MKLKRSKRSGRFLRRKSRKVQRKVRRTKKRATTRGGAVTRILSRMVPVSRTILI